MTGKELAALILKHFPDATDWNGWDDESLNFRRGEVEIGSIQPDGSVYKQNPEWRRLWRQGAPPFIKVDP